MGQYYTAVVIGDATTHTKTFSSFDYDNGAKLMEHSYIDNNFVNAVANQLVNKAQRLVWCGDYAEVEDFNCEPIMAEKIIEYADKGFHRTTNGKQNFDWNKTWYFYNVNKKEYLEIKKSNQDYNISPIPLLTAIGNGRGGGDYHGINEEYVGIWAYDKVGITTTHPNKNYTKVTIDFKE